MQPNPAGEHTFRVIAMSGKFNRWMYKTIRPHLKENILEIGSGLKKLLRSDFKLAHDQYVNALGMAGWLLYGKLLHRPLLLKQEMQAYNSLVPLAKFADFFLNRLLGLSIVFIAQKR